MDSPGKGKYRVRVTEVRVTELEDQEYQWGVLFAMHPCLEPQGKVGDGNPRVCSQVKERILGIKEMPSIHTLLHMYVILKMSLYFL